MSLSLIVCTAAYVGMIALLAYAMIWHNQDDDRDDREDE